MSETQVIAGDDDEVGCAELGDTLAVDDIDDGRADTDELKDELERLIEILETVSDVEDDAVETDELILDDDSAADLDTETVVELEADRDDEICDADDTDEVEDGDIDAEGVVMTPLTFRGILMALSPEDR